MKKSMILALSITLVILTVLALGIFVYFKFFALVYDKDGMVYQAQGGPHLCNPPHSEDDGPIDGGATDNSDLWYDTGIGDDSWTKGYRRKRFFSHL